MSTPELILLASVALCAIVVLPGTLGFLKLTNRIVAKPAGARVIYEYAATLVTLSLVGFVAGLYLTGLTAFSIVASVVLVGVCAFGFLMHAGLMFRPVREPRFIAVDQAMEEFGPDEEIVGVLDSDGQPYGFVARLARRPHIVYQPRGDAPFVMTHCILSHSSMAYAATGQFNEPDIVITSALANNMVFYEKRSRCSVIQIQNRSRDGELNLETLSTLMMKLGSWQKLFPDGNVWTRDSEWRDTFYLNVLARADVIDPASPTLVYPLQHVLNQRLPMKSLVAGVEIDAIARAYPLALFESDSLLLDKLGDRSIVFVSAFGGDYVQVFDRKVENGPILEFSSLIESHFTDTQTESTWDLRGLCVAGALQGTQLIPVPHYNKIFWFAWADYHPDTQIYAAG